MKAAEPECIGLIRACESGVSASCGLALQTCNLALISPYRANGWNVYDMRIKCGDSALCYDFSNVRKYLNRDDVRAALGVTDPRDVWEECNNGVNAGLAFGDWMLDYSKMLPELLESGIRVLVYAGDVDYICNWLGNRAWTLALQWKGGDAFRAATDEEWTAGGDGRAGVVRSAKGLTFLQIHEAGHMVPMDQPKRSLRMVLEFLGVVESTWGGNGKVRAESAWVGPAVEVALS